MSAQERGLAVVQPQALQVGPDLAERRALLQNLIMRNGSEAQVDLVMHLCGHYGLDPLLKHLVLINGAPYITRDGLLHVAHASGQFDGIEVDLAQRADGEWSATCAVYRRDMARPFRYTAFEREHKPRNTERSAWGQYPRAMLQKCAEVMALRRAFDVSLGAVEELGYDGESPQSSIGRVVTVDGEVLHPAAPAPAPQLTPPPKLAELADERLLALLGDDGQADKVRYSAAHYYLARASDAASLGDRYLALAGLGAAERRKLYAYHAGRLGLDPAPPAEASEVEVVAPPHRYPDDGDEVPF